MKFTKEQRDAVMAAANGSMQAYNAILLAHIVQDPDAALAYLRHENDPMKPIEAFGFCCPDYDWHIFSIDKGAVYSKCNNPNCQARSVYLDELNEVNPLLERLKAWSDANVPS